MPRVHHVRKARKNYKSSGIKKGESYYWWKFNYGPKIRSKVAPKPYQLTRSEFLSTVYLLEEEISSCSDKDTLTDIIDRIRALADEQDEKKNNMPENFQEAEVGELLSNRESSLNSWADDLEELSEEEIEDGIDCSYSGD